MKYLKKAILITCIFFSVGILASVAQHVQKGNHHRNGNGFHHGRNINHGVYRRSIYRPNRIRRFHPMWARNHSYHRRWLYFPTYNMYWDNWRSMYVYQNNAVWYYNATPPPTIVNVNLENEKHYELDENEDDKDSVYTDNPAHLENYKVK